MSTYDLIVIGGGVNGAGIARDAAGRGLKVLLLEKADLAEATSSRSTKLFHGGLRYLEFFKFRLVRESLMEREVLWRAMPHIAWPLRFVLPLDPAMRFPEDTPAARLLGMVMPWLKGRRPNWMIRLGLFAYDHMGGRKDLPATRSLDLSKDSAGQGLSPRITRAFEYSDVWVDDARLVLLNARDAAARGATIRTRTEALGARRTGTGWDVTFRSADGTTETAHASLLLNAAGPWVASLIEDVLHTTPPAQIRLVRGSHIITRRLFAHDRAYFFQGEDGRIIFAIPYEGDFTLIGTTDVEHRLGEAPVISDAERDYLIAFANRYLRAPISAEDIVWTYSGVRPLYDDGASSATAATRDYVLHLDRGQSGAEAPVLSVFGGKITTYRRLAEAALAKLGAADPRLASGAWTRGTPLPGGDFAPETLPKLAAELRAAHPWLSAKGAARLLRAYGTEAPQVLGTDPGQIFGADLSEAELRWMREKEWACTAEDALWRRSKLGLHLSPEETAAVTRWFEETQA
jgi:glycerol-3-phosphate dehydrogenase